MRDDKASLSAAFDPVSVCQATRSGSAINLRSGRDITQLDRDKASAEHFAPLHPAPSQSMSDMPMPNSAIYL